MVVIKTKPTQTFIHKKSVMCSVIGGYERKRGRMGEVLGLGISCSMNRSFLRVWEKGEGDSERSL